MMSKRQADARYPVKARPVTREYCEGWRRVFGHVDWNVDPKLKPVAVEVLHGGAVKRWVYR